MNGITITRKNNETITVDGICSVSVNNEQLNGQFLIYLSIPNEVVENDLVKVYISKVYDDSYTFPEEDECLFSDELWSSFKPLLFEIINGQNTFNYKFEQIVGKNFKVSYPRKPATAISDEKLQKIKQAQEKSGVDVISSDLSETPAFESNNETIVEESVTEEPAFGGETINNSSELINPTQPAENNFINETMDSMQPVENENVEKNIIQEPNTTVGSEIDNPFINTSDALIKSAENATAVTDVVVENNEQSIVDNSLFTDNISEKNDNDIIEETKVADSNTSMMNNMIEGNIKADCTIQNLDMTPVINSIDSFNNNITLLIDSINSMNESITNVANNLSKLAEVNENMNALGKSVENISQQLSSQNELLNEIKINTISLSSTKAETINELSVEKTTELQSDNKKEIDDINIKQSIPEVENEENNIEIEDDIEKTIDQTKEINPESEDEKTMSIADLMGDIDTPKESAQNNDEYIIDQSIEIPTDGTNFLNPFNIDEN